MLFIEHLETYLMDNAGHYTVHIYGGGCTRGKRFESTHKLAIL